MAQESSSHTRKSVLLVEPDDAIRRSLLDWLRSAMPGWLVIGAPTVEAAIALARAESPSLVLVDIADPETNGLEIVRKIRDAVPGTLLIALTMYDDEALRDDLATAGASASMLVWEVREGLLATVEKLLSDEGA